MAMVDGNLTANSQTSQGGSSSRVFNRGYWGFASVPLLEPSAIERMSRKAKDNAEAMCGFGEKPKLDLPLGQYVGEHDYNGKPPMPSQEAIELLQDLDAFCKREFPDTKSATFFLQQERHAKQYATSNGSEGLNSINRAACYLTLTGEDQHGKPIEVVHYISNKGNLADLDLTLPKLETELRTLHDHLQAKRFAVHARGGKQTVVLSPELAGMLAHEAMGHPCEADLVIGGAVTGNLVGRQIASELITMVDFAHTYDGEELMITEAFDPDAN